MISSTTQTTGLRVPGCDDARPKAPTAAPLHGTGLPSAAVAVQLVAVLGADVPAAPPPRGAPV